MPAGIDHLIHPGGETSTVGEPSFERELFVPPLLEPRVDERGRKVFDLRFTAGRSELLPGTWTETWGLNRPYLGPTLRARRGDEVVVNVTNDVGEATTLHWHGMHLPAVMDGGPHQLIEPGETWQPAWTIDQPAAMLWFHPHLHGQTADHVYRGAAGLFLVDDAESSALDLPSGYGVDDIPLVVQDRSFEDTGSDERPFSTDAFLGDTILVNGTYDPHVKVTTTRVRLRVLNASNARLYDLGFADDRPFTLIATDCGLLDRPVRLQRLPLTPGERAEIVVDAQPGERAVLRSFPPDLGLDPDLSRMLGGEDSFDLLELRAAAELDDSAPVPDELVPIEAPSEGDAGRTRTFHLSGTAINERTMDLQRIDEVIERGSTEIWELIPGEFGPHSFHAHLIRFLVLDVGGVPPPAHLRGWKDTLNVATGGPVRIIARFEGEADPDHPYMFHCHVLSHEDAGMMGQFVVVDPDLGSS